MPINPKREERIGFRSSSFVKLTPVKYYGGRNYTPKYRIENKTHEINGIHNPPKTLPKIGIKGKNRAPLGRVRVQDPPTYPRPRPRDALWSPATALLYRDHHSKPTQPHPPPEITCYRVSITNTKNHPKTHPKPTQNPPKTTQGPRRRSSAPFDGSRSRWAFSSAAALGARAPLLPLLPAWRRGVPPMGRPFGFSPIAALRLRRPRVRFRPLRSGPPSRSCAPAASASLGQVAVRVWTRVIPAGSGCRNPPRKLVATAFYISSPDPPLVLFFFFGADHNPRPSRMRSRVKALALP